MRIRTFTPGIHLGCHFYIRNFGWKYEYLASVKGQIYSASIDIRPRFLNRILHRLGLAKSPFTGKDDGAAVAYLTKMAQATIETVLDPKRSKKIADELCRKTSTNAGCKEEKSGQST